MVGRFCETPFESCEEGRGREVTIWRCRCNMKMLTRYFASERLLPGRRLGSRCSLAIRLFVIPSTVEESLILADNNS
jgi:hypothetical protein